MGEKLHVLVECLDREAVRCWQDVRVPEGRVYTREVLLAALRGLDDYDEGIGPLVAAVLWGEDRDPGDEHRDPR